jgi:hypothetical protein
MTSIFWVRKPAGALPTIQMATGIELDDIADRQRYFADSLRRPWRGGSSQTLASKLYCGVRRLGMHQADARAKRWPPALIDRYVEFSNLHRHRLYKSPMPKGFPKR